MSLALDRADLVTRLARALAAAKSPYADVNRELMPDKGLAHDHVRLAGTGCIARIPKQSQMGLAARENLDYQGVCFERASASGHAPRLRGRLEPSAELPRGALIVDEIVGRPARLPSDLPAIVGALAAIHRLALPVLSARVPLLDTVDPLRSLAEEIDGQAVHFDAAKLDTDSRRGIDAVRARFRKVVEGAARPPRRLISFDAHPGNFIIEASGRAVLVDLEKARYSYPPLDLAHATLYTSTTWDVEASAELSVEEVCGAYRSWLDRMDKGEGWVPWIVPLREAMWLWAVSWCAKWRVLSDADASAGGDGEDWSAGKSEAELVRHVRGRVDAYLSSAGVRRVTGEFDVLGGRFPRVG